MEVVRLTVHASSNSGVHLWNAVEARATRRRDRVACIRCYWVREEGHVIAMPMLIAALAVRAEVFLAEVALASVGACLVALAASFVAFVLETSAIAASFVAFVLETSATFNEVVHYTCVLLSDTVRDGVLADKGLGGGGHLENFSRCFL